MIHFEWPFRGWPRAEPVATSHSRTVLSMLPVARNLPSGEKDTTSTHPVWPLSVNLGVPVSVSQIRAVLSPLPVAIIDEDCGENAVHKIASP